MKKEWETKFNHSHMKHIIFLLALIATTSAAQTYQVGGAIRTFTTSDISIAPGGTITFGTSDSGLIMVSATDHHDKPHSCLPGDMRADKIPIDVINFGRTEPCRFRDSALNPIKSGINSIHGYYESEYETAWGGIITRGTYVSSSVSYIRHYDRDNPGDTVIVSGAEYVRYLPKLSGPLKNGEYSVGWEGDIAIPLCGCLRRVTIDTSRIPIGAISAGWMVKDIYNDTSSVIVHIDGSSSATVTHNNDNTITIQAYSATNEDSLGYNRSIDRTVKEIQNGWQWIWVRDKRVLIDEEDFQYNQRYAKITATESGNDLIIEIDATMFGKNKLRSANNGFFSLFEVGSVYYVYANTKRNGYSAKIPVSYFDRAINFCIESLRMEK